MILKIWVDKCNEHHINIKEQTPVLHCSLFMKNFREHTMDVLVPLLPEMRIISAFKDARKLSTSLLAAEHQGRLMHASIACVQV